MSSLRNAISARRSRIVLIAAVTAASLLAAPAHAKKLLTDVPLLWRPTSDIEREDENTDAKALALESTARAVHLEIAALIDARKETDRIAENREDEEDGKILPVTTRDDVANWCTQHLSEVMERLGLEVVEKDGDVILTGEVRRFFVVETGTYNADIGLKLTLKSRTGEQLWSGVTSGTASRWGGSYKLGNYYEVFSDGLIDAAVKLVAFPDFLEALAKGAKPVSQ